MLKINLFICIAVLLLSANFVAGQQNTASPYSRYGIGELELNSFGQSPALGGISRGLRSFNHLNPENPASYNALYMQSFIFESGFKAKSVDYTTQASKSSGGTSNLAYIAAATPITSWWTSCAGISPYSSIGYNFTKNDSILVENVYNKVDFNYIGDGGLNRFFWGNAFKISKRISAGFNISYIFGNLSRTASTSISTSDFQKSATNNYSTFVSNFLVSYGLQYTDSIKKKYAYTIGITFDNKTSFNTENTRFVTTSTIMNGLQIVDTLINTKLNSNSITLPNKIGVGFTLSSEKFIIGADYVYQDWTNAKFLDEEQPYTSSEYYGAGFEYCPNRYTTKFFQSIRYRFGAYHTRTNITLKGQNINDYGLTMGLGIPLKSGSILNFGLQYGSKGTTTNNLLKEDYLIFTLNFSLFDIWFIKRKFD